MKKRATQMITEELFAICGLITKLYCLPVGGNAGVVSGVRSTARSEGMQLQMRLAVGSTDHLRQL